MVRFAHYIDESRNSAPISLHVRCARTSVADYLREPSRRAHGKRRLGVSEMHVTTASQNRDLVARVDAAGKATEHATVDAVRHTHYRCVSLACPKCALECRIIIV